MAFVAAATVCFGISVHPARAQNAGAFPGLTLVLEDGVMDLRANAQIRQASGARVMGYAGMDDLEVGSIFISPDNVALRVVAISQVDGDTVIETDQPPIREVIASCEMPDQEIPFTAADIVPESVQPGVTVLTPHDATQQRQARELPLGPTWLDTETKSSIQSDDTVSVSFDLLLFKSEKKAEPEKDKGADGKDNKWTTKSTSGGKPEPSTSTETEVRLKGSLTLAKPVLKGGLRMPAMNIKWVTVWWCIGYPEISFDSGYLKASFEAAEQINAQLVGSASLTQDIKFPLYGFAVQNPSVGKLSVGVYIKVSVSGKITVLFEIDQYARMGLWGTVDLAWPFIPYDVSTGSELYYNFAVRPSISAEVELDIGPAVGVDIEILGFKLVEAEAFGGLYGKAAGSVFATDVFGLDKNVGPYGDLSKWAYTGSVEIGGFFKLHLGIASFEDDIVDQKWPFFKLNWKGSL